MKPKYFVQEWDMNNGPIVSDCAIMRSGAFSNVFGHVMSNASYKEIEGLLKITYKGKSIYRKYVGWNLAETDSVILSARSISELGINVKENKEAPYEVKVEVASGFCYLWHNSSSYVRVSFRIAFVGLMVSVLFGLTSVVLSILQLLCCC